MLTIPKKLYCVKLCVVLTNTRIIPLCKIRFDSDECFIVLFFEIIFDLTNTQNLKELLFH